MVKNPIIWSDFPDVDVIRVEDTYYMVSTTMHFMPGCVILRSYDLMHWEIASYVYETLDGTKGQRLEDGVSVYGKGMWAASLRYHENKFYICFVANDTGKTYLYTADTVEGPWKKQVIEGFYHDCSLLFDGDRRFIVYGNRQIYVTELAADFSGPKPGGLHRMLVEDTEEYGLGFEGSHLYKIGGKYYLFLIHWPKREGGRRQEACYMADSLEGEFRGGNVLDDDLGFHNQGVAQGGIVDTPWGDWYGMLFQDHGAVGRIPVLVPVTFEHDFPVFGTNGAVPSEVEIKSTRPDYCYEPLFVSDDFICKDGRPVLSKVWQWNHEPDPACWSFNKEQGGLRITTDRVVPNVVKAKNSLTQRTTGPVSVAEITVDASELKDGDYAGISAFQNHYGMIAVTKEAEDYYIVMLKRSKDEEGVPWHLVNDTAPGIECARVKLNAPVAKLKVRCDFRDKTDVAGFFYEDGGWHLLGEQLHMDFDLAHFTGYRFALSCFSTKQAGGSAEFRHFIYTVEQ